LEQQDPAPQQPAPHRNQNPTRRPRNALGDGSPTEQHKMGKHDWKKAVAEDSSKVPYTQSQWKKQQNQLTLAQIKIWKKCIPIPI
ncbi:hypothetical protein H0H81_010423, partial [Sphagnurus paluster]